MDSGTLSGIITVLFFVLFVLIVWWAFSGRNKDQFEAAGRLPFEEDAPETRRD